MCETEKRAVCNETEQRNTKKEFMVPATDGLLLSCVLFPCENPKGVIQMIHGAKEHKERYYDFCSFLQRNGYAVLISDIRGHGASLNEKYSLGYMDGLSILIEDQRALTSYVRKMYPGVSLHLFGHSFGSMIARKYMQTFDGDLTSVVLSGTANYIKLVKPGMVYGNLVIKKKGERGHNLFMMNAKEEKDDSWLVYNEEILKNYRKDPLCGKGCRYTNRAVLTVWEANRELKNYKAYECKNPTLPILSISGADDPVTGFKKGLRDSVRNLERVGYKNIRTIVYPGMKHEVINEVGKEQVYKDVLAFIFLASSCQAEEPLLK